MAASIMTSICQVQQLSPGSICCYFYHCHFWHCHWRLLGLQEVSLQWDPGRLQERMGLNRSLSIISIDNPIIRELDLLVRYWKVWEEIASLLLILGACKQFLSLFPFHGVNENDINISGLLFSDFLNHKAESLFQKPVHTVTSLWSTIQYKYRNQMIFPASQSRSLKKKKWGCLGFPRTGCCQEIHQTMPGHLGNTRTLGKHLAALPNFEEHFHASVPKI